MKQKYLLVFLAVLMLFCIITGIVYGINNNYDVDLYLKTLVNHNNMFLENFLIVSIFFFSTLSIIGILAQCVVIGVEGISLGYIFTIFFNKYKLKGIFFVIIHFILNKLIMFLIMFYLFYVSYNFIKKICANLVGIKKDYINTLFIPFLRKYLIIMIVTLINSIFIYFCSNFILYYVSLML